MLYMIRMANATSNVTFLPSYGQVKDNEVPTKGLMGKLVEDAIEVGGSPLVMFPVRMKYFEYTNFYMPYSGVIVFRAPPLSYEHNVFTLPFPASLWGVSGIMMLLCTALLAAVLHSAETLTKGAVRQDNALHASSDALLIAVASVCQQGYSVEVRSVPGRTVLLMMLMLLLLLYTCYSASIVVFMQSTGTKVAHYRDLLTSQMAFGINDIPHVVFYFPTLTDPIRRALWKDKILDKGRNRHVYNVSEGIRKVRTEYFAFYGIEHYVFGTISRTWTEEDKCGLVIMGRDFNLFQDPHVIIRRNSHNTKAFKIMMRRMVERGIWHRSKSKYTFARPTCTNKKAVFNSVSLTDVRAAFSMLLFLMSGSLVLLVAEVAWHRITVGWRSHI
ncbi:uncharacterized protein LOC117639025 isoform X2 [Thrips palmi]|nr:uncharacterized protein LOC117639025 isoform X2 [Thrips palmi]